METSIGICRTFFRHTYRHLPDGLSAFAGHFSFTELGFFASDSHENHAGGSSTKLVTNIFCKQRGDCGLRPTCLRNNQRPNTHP